MILFVSSEVLRSERCFQLASSLSFFMIIISSYWINDNCGFLVVSCALYPCVVLHVHPIPSSASTLARAGCRDNGESVLDYKCNRVTFSCMPMLTGMTRCSPP